MTRPIVDPSSLFIKIKPGENSSTSITIANVPSAGEITAFIKNGNALITLKNIIAFRPLRRPFTEEEINELPPFPPSIREKARINGVIEQKEIGRTNGITPLVINAGDMIQFIVEYSAPVQQNLDLTTASLSINGTTFETINVPIYMLIGTPMTLPTVEPTYIKKSAEPGEIQTVEVIIENVPTFEKVIGFIANGDSIIQLKQMIAYRTIKRKFTNLEIEELPPYPPSIREDAKRDGYIEYQQVSKSDGNTPLTVSPGDMVRFYIEISVPLEHFPDEIMATFIIDAASWQRVEIPMSLIIGKISVELSTNSLSLRQGGSSNMNLTLTSEAGPGTEVYFDLGMNGGQWKIEPEKLFISQSESLTSPIKVLADPKAPLGTFPVGFQTLAFDRRQFRQLPFNLTVKPALVTARLLQTNVTGFQGEKVTVQVEVKSFGGYKVVSLNPNTPPIGVQMTSLKKELSYGASTSVIPIEFTINHDAPSVANHFMSILWSAGDGEHSGALFLKFNVNEVLESRSFSYQITTPSPHSLGGKAEITIRSDGTYTFKGHIKNSGFDPYAFRVNVVIRDPSGRVNIAAVKSGSVGGTILGGKMDYKWEEPGTNSLIKTNWTNLRNGTAAFSKWYEDKGVLGTLEDIGTALAQFLGTTVIVGPIVAAAIVVGSELGEVTNIPFLYPTILTGVVVAGGTILILGPGALIPAIVAGGLAVEHVQARPLREDEKQLAAKVFGIGTLPIDKILITNLDRPDRKFCIPSIDGKILMGLGDWYDNPLQDEKRQEIFIHELTHAWQFKNNPVISEIIWQAIINEIKGTEDVYTFIQNRNINRALLDGRPWGGYGMEVQAQIVQAWFSLYRADLNSEAALNDAMFTYIQNNIRMGQP
ncbi:hypothetical protein [Bacillus cereus]|uniref:COG1470 family protein n=1 Tax=Bacillus cereus TaxID=1396 RepID=UPI000BC05AA5|nr:hypothetical protein [Bacillus cereus]ASZ69451.1 hypothetical protein CJ306_29875 [Bacillus cereus]